jgi:hypothetical protein
LNVANSHYRHDGTTLVHGFVDEDLPYTLVKDIMYIDDPVSLVGGGVLASLSGSGSGTVSVTADDALGVIHVDASNITFSKRAVVIKRGVVVPRSGVVKAAKRYHPKTTVKVTVNPGVSRGSKVTGYQVRCYKASGSKKLYVHVGYLKAGHGYIVTVTGVGSGTRYCQVRVNSRSGYGPWGSPVKVH